MTNREYQTSIQQLRDYLAHKDVDIKSKPAEWAQIELQLMLIERLEALVQQTAGSQDIVAAQLVRLSTQIQESLADVAESRSSLSRDQAINLLVGVGLNMDEAADVLDTTDMTKARAIVNKAQRRMKEAHDP